MPPFILIKLIEITSHNIPIIAQTQTFSGIEAASTQHY